MRIALIVIMLLTLLGVILGPKDALGEDLVFGQYLMETQEEMRTLYKKAKSIAICEGYYHDGTIARRLNNPGNLKAGPPSDKHGHTIYETSIEGWLALYKLLITVYKGMTPYQMNRWYATDKTWYNCINYYFYN